MAEPNPNPPNPEPPKPPSAEPPAPKPSAPPPAEQVTAQSKIASELTKLFPSGVIPEGRTSIKLAKELAPDDAPPAPAAPAAPAAPPLPEPPAPSPEDKAKKDAADAAAKKAAADATPPPEPKKEDGPTKEQLDAAEAKMDIKAGTAFKLVRSELATEQAERAKERESFQAQIAEAQAKASTVNEAEIKALKERVNRYEGELSIRHVESTEQFQTEIAQPLEATEKQLKALAAKYEISEGKLAAALTNPDVSKRSDELSELTANFNRIDTVRFDNLSVEIEKLGGKKQLALTEAHKKLAEFQAQQEAALVQRKEQFKVNWAKALDTSRQILEKELPVFRKTGDEKWDVKLEDAMSKVKSIDVGSMSDEELAKSLYKAGAFPLVLKLIADLYGENSSQAEELATFRQATPGAGAGAPPPLGDDAKPKPYTTMPEAVKGRLAGVLPP